MNSLETKIEDVLKKFFEKNDIDLDYVKFDSKLTALEKNSKAWIEQFDKTDMEVYLNLLGKFKYMTRLSVINELRNLFEVYKKIEPNYVDTIFVPVSSFGGIYNGAINIVECFEEVLEENDEITKKSIPIDPVAYYNTFDLSSVKNVVFLDDIIGSGDTFINFLYRISMDIPSLIGDRKIYLLSLFNLEKGINNIEGMQDLDWDITLINTILEKSIFEDPSINEDQNKKKLYKSVVRKYERRLAKEKSEEVYIMGYKRSEILLGLFYNTPNNTLSTFWKKMEIGNLYFRERKIGISTKLKMMIY
ncbi:hypothetical protein ACFVT8_16395 [Lysinibacillus sp. NPDC058147]|uniref:phosphoribosyltransferase-like protein n=1 Tax=unclassified Lysinibacillus TaxID=2636778 RepID=UPI0036D9E2F5